MNFIKTSFEIATGLPSNDSSEWAAYAAKKRKLFKEANFSGYFRNELGYSEYPQKGRFPGPGPLLTVYATPEELNYPDIRKRANTFNLEVFNKPPKRSTLIPLEELGISKSFLTDNLEGKFSGKLVYLSMGSMGSVDLKLMRRLVKVLGRTNHKYIVSKGHLHEQLDLERNMTGGRYLPQVDILPHVHLVISHGGK